MNKHLDNKTKWVNHGYKHEIGVIRNNIGGQKMNKKNIPKEIIIWSVNDLR